MKTLFLAALLTAGFAQAHDHDMHDMKNPGCMKIHDACEAAKMTGKKGHMCMHNIMSGKSVAGVTDDLSAAVTDCKAAKGMKHDKDMPETQAAPGSAPVPSGETK